MEFSTRPIHNPIRNQGDLRVSEHSARGLGEILERFAGDIAEVAVEIAQKEGYQIVKAQQILKGLINRIPIWRYSLNSILIELIPTILFSTYRNRRTT